MKKIKMMAFDIDGTFVTDEKKITRENLEILSKLAGEGVHLVLSTGRMPESAKNIVEDIKLGVNISACNGSKLYINHADEMLECIHERYFDYDLIKEVLEFVDGWGIYYHFYDSDMVYTNRTREMVNQYYKLFVKDVENGVKTCEKLSQAVTPQMNVLKLGIFGDGTFDFDKLKSELEEDKRLKIFMSHDNYMDVNLAGVDKWYGLEKLAQYFGIATDEIMYFGDQGNDLHAVEMAGIGVAMKNATDDVKKHADVITQYDNNNSGVARCINSLLAEGKITFK